MALLCPESDKLIPFLLGWLRKLIKPCLSNDSKQIWNLGVGNREEDPEKTLRSIVSVIRNEGPLLSRQHRCQGIAVGKHKLVRHRLPCTERRATEE